MSANDSVEEEEILTVSHVADLLKEKMGELRGTAHDSGTAASGRKVRMALWMHAVHTYCTVEYVVY